MIETKGSPERRAVARQLLAMRRLERLGECVDDRGGGDYIHCFKGLRRFLDYTRAVPGSNLVLDIGAGITRGVNDLSKSEKGRNLKFMATGLVSKIRGQGDNRYKRVDNSLGSANLRLTSGEILRGIADNSVAGVMALFSIAYSACPEMVIDRINQVLVPGGVIKAVVGSQNLKISRDDYYDRTGLQTADRFVAQLDSLGYEIALSDDSNHSIILAIKPGWFRPHAQRLMDADLSIGRFRRVATDALADRT